jgi:hypothetical protein
MQDREKEGPSRANIMRNYIKTEERNTVYRGNGTDKQRGLVGKSPEEKWDWRQDD